MRLWYKKVLEKVAPERSTVCMFNMRLVKDYLPLGSYKRKMGNVECHNKHNLKIRQKIIQCGDVDECA